MALLVRDSIICHDIAVARHGLLLAYRALLTLAKRLMELSAGCAATGTEAIAGREHGVSFVSKANPSNERAIGAVVNQPLCLLQ